VRKTSINAIINHPSNVPIENTGSRLVQKYPVLSRRIKIPKAIVIKVKITINLLGGVHPIFFHQIPY
jgi:hypothetical protein